MLNVIWTSIKNKLKYSKNNFDKSIAIFVTLLIGTVILLRISLLNGYPIFFGDSSGYIFRGVSREISHHWALFYSLFIDIASFGTTLWGVVVLQCLLISYTILRIFQQLFSNLFTSIIGFGFAILVLTFFSSLSFLTNLIMADYFTGLGVVVLGLLVVKRKLDFDFFVFLIVLIFAILGHKSNGPIFMACGIPVVCYKLFQGFAKQNLVSIIAMVLSIYVFPLVGEMIVERQFQAEMKNEPNEQVKVSDSKYHFIWVKAKNFEEVYEKFLEESCPKEKYKYLCNREKYNSYIKKYRLKSIFHDHGNHLEFLTEIENAGRKIILEPEFYPYFLRNTLGGFKKLLFKQGKMYRDKGFNKRVAKRLFKIFRSDKKYYDNSLTVNRKFSAKHFTEAVRNRGKLAFLFALYSNLLLIPTLLIFRRKLGINSNLIEIVVFLFGFVIVHHFLMGTFSNATNVRYSGRVNWVIILNACIMVVGVFSAYWNRFEIMKNKMNNDDDMS